MDGLQIAEQQDPNGQLFVFFILAVAAAEAAVGLAIRRTIRFFLLRKMPTMLIANKIAPRIRKWDKLSKVPPRILSAAAPPRSGDAIFNPVFQPASSRHAHDQLP